MVCLPADSDYCHAITRPTYERELQFSHCTARLRIYTSLPVSQTLQLLKYRLCFEILGRTVQIRGSDSCECEGYGLPGCDAV
jgi:hypothetical protein